MRTEAEIMNIILGVAMADERIRAVSMEGSRANPSAPKDKYQDYDITYYVTDVKALAADASGPWPGSWLSAFGTPLIVQEPDWNDGVIGLSGGGRHDIEKSYAWLMLLDDGIRVDLGIYSVNSYNDPNGEPSVVLLDKDGVLPELSAPSDRAYWVKRPSGDEFRACCNEFWWCLNNVAKGIARDELPYAMWMYNQAVRDMLNKMVEWHIGVMSDFSASAGKLGKYFRKYLPPELYKRYAATYSGADYREFWAAVYTICGLFHDLAVSVAGHLGFTYRQKEEDGMRAYLRMIKMECEW
ncbi:MAG: aminoglycoside 6-adenylyltransferase [Defluviitaleaceae bacterium]|nr:aminoglycoside 6-adenylyltransferase [Defluviitaleaceae bacterium]